MFFQLSITSAPSKPTAWESKVMRHERKGSAKMRLSEAAISQMSRAAEHIRCTTTSENFSSLAYTGFEDNVINDRRSEEISSTLPYELISGTTSFKRGIAYLVSSLEVNVSATLSMNMRTQSVAAGEAEDSLRTRLARPKDVLIASLRG